MKTSIPPVLNTFALACVALLQNAQAVVPAPDGGYPNFTTAEGTKALQSLTSGSANTGVGWFSLFSNATGTFNTATGAGSLLFNTADQNTAFGAAALLFNTTGINNTAVGAAALLHNTVAEENTATGAFALSSNNEGDFNTANGAFALQVNTEGERNTAIGDSAMFSNTIGNQNTATGNAALGFNTTGNQNTATGAAALFNNTSGGANTATGASALLSNTDGDFNTAVGLNALNINMTGNNNIALGFSAGSNITGDNNIDIGSTGGGSESGTIRIGQSGSQTRTFIAGISGATVTGTAVVVDGSGQLGVAPSSARFKEAIKSMDNASEALFSLKPVTFRYKKEIDPQGISQLGLVAEEVEKVNRDLVVRDKDGKPFTVRYDQVNAMLLNEFLKEHRKVEQQSKDFEAALAQQQTQIDALTAGLQKLSAQLELNKPAERTVLNDQ
jgi:Chaperone of endosialidase